MFEELFDRKIESIKKTGQYRIFIPIDRVQDNYPLAKCDQAKNNKAIVWCSNDYLGMSQNTSVVKFAHETIDKFGMGAGGSRNIGGTSSLTCELEKNIADRLKTESALIFPTGFSSNDATLQCLIRLLDDLVVFSDENNHASIINALRQSGAKGEIFKHNDVEHLITLLQKYPKNTKKLVVFESIYSMDGDVAPIKEIVEVAKEYGCFTFLDEVHAIGMYGPEGRGISAELGVNNEIDIRSFAPGFIFRTALPPAIIAASTESIKIIRSSPDLREKLQVQTQKLRRALINKSIPVMQCSTTHVLPLLAGNTGNSETLG